MTAVESLRNWFAHKERPPIALDVVGDTIDTRAIPELADRVEAIEKDAGLMAAMLRYKTGGETPEITPLKTPEPEFKGITGTGWYRTRSGIKVHIVSVDDAYRGFFGLQPAKGAENDSLKGYVLNWSLDGSFRFASEKHKLDIVAGPLTEEPEQAMAGLSGFAPVFAHGRGEIENPHIYGVWDTPKYALKQTDEYGPLIGVIDLSTIRKDQLVKHGPKRETGWLNIYDRPCAYFSEVTDPCVADTGSAIHLTRAAADEAAMYALHKEEMVRIACVGITFEHGQGLS